MSTTTTSVQQTVDKTKTEVESQGLSELQGLNVVQISAVKAHLSLYSKKFPIEKLEDASFTPMHTLAMQAGISIETIGGKSGHEVFQLMVSPINASLKSTMTSSSAHPSLSPSSAATAKSAAESSSSDNLDAASVEKAFLSQYHASFNMPSSSASSSTVAAASVSAPAGPVGSLAPETSATPATKMTSGTSTTSSTSAAGPSKK